MKRAGAGYIADREGRLVPGSETGPGRDESLGFAWKNGDHAIARASSVAVLLRLNYGRAMEEGIFLTGSLPYLRKPLTFTPLGPRRSSLTETNTPCYTLRVERPNLFRPRALTDQIKSVLCSITHGTHP